MSRSFRGLIVATLWLFFSAAAGDMWVEAALERR